MKEIARKTLEIHERNLQMNAQKTLNRALIFPSLSLSLSRSLFKSEAQNGKHTEEAAGDITFAETMVKDRSSWR
jgi:hypothetical protein